MEFFLSLFISSVFLSISQSLFYLKFWSKSAGQRAGFEHNPRTIHEHYIHKLLLHFTCHTLTTTLKKAPQLILFSEAPWSEPTTSLLKMFGFAVPTARDPLYGHTRSLLPLGSKEKRLFFIICSFLIRIFNIV